MSAGAEWMEAVIYPHGRPTDPHNVQQEMLLQTLWPEMGPHTVGNNQSFEVPGMGRMLMILVGSGAVDLAIHARDQLHIDLDVYKFFNGQIDSSRELFSNGMVGLDRRGLAGLAWMDSNYDGRLDTSDPVFNQLRVWQDKNGNGIVDAGEETTLAQDGITSLNYSMGQFSENGQIRQMASPDLTVIKANSDGVEAVNEHLYFCERMAA